MSKLHCSRWKRRDSHAFSLRNYYASLIHFLSLTVWRIPPFLRSFSHPFTLEVSLKVSFPHWSNWIFPIWYENLARNVSPRKVDRESSNHVTTIADLTFDKATIAYSRNLKILRLPGTNLKQYLTKLELFVGICKPRGMRWTRLRKLDRVSRSFLEFMARDLRETMIGSRSQRAMAPRGIAFLIRGLFSQARQVKPSNHEVASTLTFSLTHPTSSSRLDPLASPSNDRLLRFLVRDHPCPTRTDSLGNR